MFFAGEPRVRKQSSRLKWEPLNLIARISIVSARDAKAHLVGVDDLPKGDGTNVWRITIDPAYLSALNKFELFLGNIMFVESRVINSPKESTANAANNVERAAGCRGGQDVKTEKVQDKYLRRMSY